MNDTFWASVGAGSYLGWIISGYDATTSTSFASSQIQNTTYAISFMSADPGRNSIDANLSDLLPIGLRPGYWIDFTTYGIILQNLVSPPLLDPAVVIVSGVLTESGEFTFGPSAALPNGTLSASNPSGDLSINTLDQNGKILNSVSIQQDFTVNVLYQPGKVSGPAVVDAGAMPVVVTLPFESTVDSFSVVQNGKIIKQTSLNAQTLQGLIVKNRMNASTSISTTKKKSSFVRILSRLIKSFYPVVY
jgi:hypothetical protein